MSPPDIDEELGLRYSIRSPHIGLAHIPSHISEHESPPGEENSAESVDVLGIASAKKDTAQGQRNLERSVDTSPGEEQARQQVSSEVRRGFKPIPKCSWEVRGQNSRNPGNANVVQCARTQPRKEFIGHTILKELYKIPSWWPNWATLNIESERIIHWGCRIDHGRTMFQEEPIRTKNAELPPSKPYVVLGVFDDSGRLLQEVIVYIGGRSRSRHLVHGRRRLFKLPILRDIRRFGLYRVGPLLLRGYQMRMLTVEYCSAIKGKELMSGSTSEPKSKTVLRRYLNASKSGKHIIDSRNWLKRRLD
jgi:hypothetical protein